MARGDGFKIIRLPFKSRVDILACGGELKNTFCLVGGDKMFISGNNGDLEDVDNFTRYEKAIGAALRKLTLRPRLICADMHPEYLSTKFARSLADEKGIPLKLIQHHHAHVASCMLENGQSGRAIVVAFDGTGFGSDGNLWGAEFLVFDFRKFARFAYLKYLPLAGGNKSILEPWRLAAAWLYTIYKEKFLGLNLDFVKRMDKARWKVLKQMLDKNINCPLSSSIGRFFDAVSCLVGARDVVEYEAQAAIELERQAARLYPQDVPAYAFGLKQENGLVIEPGAIFSGIVKDLVKKEKPEKIALKFHYTIANIVNKVCRVIRKEKKLNRVCLSGGVFQNKILTPKTKELLQSSGFEVFQHSSTPGDGCISAGQAAVGLYQSRKG